MEKLFKLVCANFALKSIKPLSCHDKLENRVDDANIMFIGMHINRALSRPKAVGELAKFLNMSTSNVNLFADQFDKMKCKRFEVKKGLINNGLKL